MAQQVLELCENGLALDGRLPAILDGVETPADADEALKFARLCVSKRQHAGAARLFAFAFSASPSLAEDARSDDRYNAACCAALAARSSGEGAAEFDDEQRATWRRQARDWLLAELSARESRLDSGAASDRVELLSSLTHWTEDPDLASLRDEPATVGLSESEREECRTLWRAVESLKHRVEESQ
jgi:hypothetical protein